MLQMISSPSPFRLLSSVYLLLLLLHASTTVMAVQQYNQVQLRVFENIDRFLDNPVEKLNLFHAYYDLGGFPNNLTAPDRTEARKYLYALITALDEAGLKPFYGLEDGTLMGYWHGTLNQQPLLVYREPGNSGYAPEDETLGKYFGVCQNQTTGLDKNCSMTTNTPLYVSCINDCALVPCAGLDVTSEQKWCRNYEIKEYVEQDLLLGYVPLSYHCMDEQGAFSQTPGRVQIESPDGIISDGICTFEDGTLVDRVLTGPFANCAMEAVKECSTTYLGAYRYTNYDPRWRDWYIHCREAQVPRFSDAYIFFNFGTVGITYTHPIFNVDAQGRDVFAGVLAVDMELSDVANFLESTFEDTNFSAAVYEYSEPYYMIASSTGTGILAHVLKVDETQTCNQEQIDTIPRICVLNRLTINNFVSTEADVILRKGHEVFLTKEDHNGVNMVAVRQDDDNAASTSYLVTTLLYERPGQNLKWRIVVTNPLEGNPDDYILPGEGMYLLLCIIAGLGFCLCFFLFIAMYRRRNERAIQFGDLQFTSAFILGCAALNLSIFAFLGNPSDELCLTRMWVFYMLTTMMLAPLLVKTYRTYRLLGSPVAKAMNVKINNRDAWMRTLPIIITQVVILIVFTLTDPPVVTETIDVDDSNPTKGLRCEQETLAFSWTQGAYVFFLLVTGCILAYMTRNVDPRFGDAKALFFVIYNITFTTLMLSLIITFVAISESGMHSLQAIGVFWATVFSSAAFVLPRLTAAKKERLLVLKRNRRMRTSIESQRRNRVDTASRIDGDEQRHNSEDALKVLVCTANVGNAPPTLTSMKAWIPEGGSCSGIKTLNEVDIAAQRFDLIVIGMQEATWGSKKQRKQQLAGDDGSMDVNSFDDDENSLEEAKAKEENYLAAIEGADTAALRKMIKLILGDGYTNIAQEQRGQMRQTIWALTHVAPFIKDLRVSGANTGVGNVLANKGGIVVSMIYQDTRMTFLSAHLAAHEGENYFKARCQNVSDILQTVKTFKLCQKALDLAICSHHMFVCGDLNFRTKFDGENHTHEENIERAGKLIEARDWKTLYSFDELHKAVKDGDLLVNFETLPCNFHPTFKVNRKEGFEYKDQRCPSYTDRILYKSAPNLGDNLQPLSYEACVDFITSDHKPVRGAFSIVPNGMIAPRVVEGTYRIAFSGIECTDLLAADVEGTSDPYVKFIWDSVDMSEEHTTNFKFWKRKSRFPTSGWKSKTLNPKWPDKVISLVTTSHNIAVDAMLYVAVYDYDFLQDDDMLGTLCLSVQQLIAMSPEKTSKELVFDRPLERYGKFGGRIKFKLEVSMLVG